MYKYEVAISTEQNAINAYNEAIRIVLEIPPLANESSGATRVVQCLFKPSFHPECSISIVEREATTEMTVRVPARSVWSLVNARQGSPDGNPVTGWVKPAVSAEQIVMTEAATFWRATVDESQRTSSPEGLAWGIDGMSVDVLLWRAGVERSFGVWFGPFDDTNDRHRLIRTVVETALKLAKWGPSVAGLEQARRYLAIST